MDHSLVKPRSLEPISMGREWIILVDYNSKTLSLKLMEGFTAPKIVAAVESVLERRQIFCYRYSGKQ